MDNINVNLAALEEKIGKLQTLHATCSAIDVSPVEMEGSGLSIQTIQAVDNEYAQVKETMLTLLSHSITFFQDVKESLVAADQEAANQLHQGG